MSYENERVQVYLNTKRNCLSVRSKREGRVVLYADSVGLADVKFTVQPSGRQRAREEKQKNVHAWVEGDLLFWDRGESEAIDDDWSWVDVTYNPFQYDSFVMLPACIPVERALFAYINGKTVKAVGVE